MNAEIDQQPTQEDVLSDILYTLQSQRFEPGGIFTIGGGNGTYQLKSPFNTECEYCVLSVSTSVGTPVAFTISQSNPNTLAPSGFSSFGATVNGGEGNALEGLSGFVSASSSYSSSVWQPLGRGVYIYMNVNPGASNAILANIAFRRSYLHLIPDRVRQLAPSTHSRPVSRRDIRLIDGMSKQFSGFVAQYPELERGKERYHHNEIPWEQDPKGAQTHMRGQARSGK